jgi:hypothetical protein
MSKPVYARKSRSKTNLCCEPSKKIIGCGIRKFRKSVIRNFKRCREILQRHNFVIRGDHEVGNGWAVTNGF